MDDLQAPNVPGFKVGRLLGRGGSADVWLGQEHRTGRPYAIKCFRSAGPGAQAGNVLPGDAVQREIRILSVLEHQHLVKAHQAVRFDGGPGVPGTALVMDYAAGGSLAQLLAVRGRLTVGEMVTVLAPIAQALAYLHGKGFTHSDVSPGNVLFTGQGKPLLSDVGIARILGEPGRAGREGTAGFLDPAPVDAVRAGLQPERDVYAAAAVGWYCLTGEAPALTADRPPLSVLVPEVPREMAAVLESGLHEDRRLRPTAAVLATAVYRSAPPRPVDLAAAVHPSVIPELVTRRHVPQPPAPSKLLRQGKLREKWGALYRRFATLRWAGDTTPALRLPFPAQAGTPSPDQLPLPPMAVPSGPGSSTVPAPPLARVSPPARAGKARGRHAGTATGSVPARRRLKRYLPAVVVLAVGSLWWLAGTATEPADPAVTPNQAAATPAASRMDETPDAAQAARQQAAAADPAQALAGLAALRDHALSSGELHLLAEVNAAGSPAAVADGRTGDRLSSSGLVLAGFSSILSEVATETGATPARAVVRVTSSTSAYEEKDAAGTVLANGAATAGQPLRLVLVAVEGRWRISEILPADATS